MKRRSTDDRLERLEQYTSRGPILVARLSMSLPRILRSSQIMVRLMMKPTPNMMTTSNTTANALSVGKLESLEFFYIGTNLLQELPVGLAQLTNLVELNVAGSGGLLVIPNMRDCRRLERLYIDSTTLFDASFNPRTISRLEIYMVGR